MLVHGRIYKPKRLLYYIVPTEDEIAAFYKGKMPDRLMEYGGAFGTYDWPGMFILKSDDLRQIVFGIEFRPNDERLHYPEGMECMELPAGFMISTDFPEEKITLENLKEKIEKVRAEVQNMRFSNGLVSLQDVPDLIQCLTLNGHNKLVISADAVKSTFGFATPKTEVEERLYRAAYHDSITGHTNWNYLWPMMANFGENGIQDFVFAHFDVKDFKAINVVYGHEVGNRLLRRIAEKLQNTDWIYHSARCDNDNFAAMIHDMPMEEIQKKMLAFFSDLEILDADDSYHVYFRCGIVPMRVSLLLGDTVADAGKQVQNQGDKLYETEVLVYSEPMQDEIQWSARIRAYLETAIERDEFLIYLQPKYDISTERICGAEALIRWHYKGREMLAPYRFIPVFETGGMISRLDDIVLNKVCQCLKNWEKQGLPLHPISVNLSRKSLANPNLINHLTNIVDFYCVDHGLIDFELTETATYDDQDYMISVIKQLKEQGFKLSMDDFGTGYSSLSLLPIMPFDIIKIDKSFVDGLNTTEKNRKECTMVKYVIAMSKELGYTCLAEGAEYEQQVNLLREYGCEIVQGFYYSKPMPVEEFEAKLLEEQ